MEMSYEDLKFTMEQERELSRKTQDLSAFNIPRIIASCIPGGNPSKPLLALELMTVQEIQQLCCSQIAEELAKAFMEYNKKRRTSGTQEILDSNASMEPSKGSNTKFALQKATFGPIEEYDGGLESTLGLPDTDLWNAMFREHCKSNDSENDFQPGNYPGKETSPQKCVPVAQTLSYNNFITKNFIWIDCIPNVAFHCTCISKPFSQAVVMDVSVCMVNFSLFFVSSFFNAYGSHKARAYVCMQNHFICIWSM
jgi:hypothetical protein